MALRRAAEIASLVGLDVALPALSSVPARDGVASGGGGRWEEFWSATTPGGPPGGRVTNAARLSSAVERLGPTFVKFAQALGSRPDVVPPSLSAAFSRLQDDMEPFDSDAARDIVLEELMGYRGGDDGSTLPLGDVEALLSNLTEEPVAAASVGQVYRSSLPGRGDVAVKVQRPGIRDVVARDAELLLGVARFLESLPALPGQREEGQTRLINTELVSTTGEFVSRIFEEMDYTNEANVSFAFVRISSFRRPREEISTPRMREQNCQLFAELYSEHAGNSTDVSVVVPRIYPEYCTENVLVMEWIDGTKLTDVGSDDEDEIVAENLELIRQSIDSTLSQLLVTGVLHADPHAGNLLKIRRDDGSVTLGYLDFGILSTIPERVRDGLTCAVALQVFGRDVDAVAALFGELMLIPQAVLDDVDERAALAEALEITFEESLLYPDAGAGGDDGGEAATGIPVLKFDKLLDALSRLVPRFRFDLPPYFINNARALSTLEGIAKGLDPSFNVLEIMYPYALNRLLRNPSGSPVVERTVQALIRDDEGKVDRSRIRRVLRDSALISNKSRRRVVWDIVKTRPGRRLAAGVMREELRDGGLLGRGERRRRRRGKTTEGRRRRWYYLGLN